MSIMRLFDTVLSLPTTYSKIVAISTCIVVAIAIYRLCFAVHYPRNLPLLGEPEGARAFSWKTRKRYYTDCAALYREAYQKVSKDGSAKVLLTNSEIHDLHFLQSMPEMEKLFSFQVSGLETISSCLKAPCGGFFLALRAS